MANFGHLETKNKNGRRGAANCPKEFFFFGEKGPTIAIFQGKTKKKVELAIFRALVVVFRFLYVAISIGEFEKISTLSLSSTSQIWLKFFYG